MNDARMSRPNELVGPVQSQRKRYPHIKTQNRTLSRKNPAKEPVMKPILFVMLLIASNMACALISASGNGIVVMDNSGSLQSNSPETVTRFFKEGEIPHYAQAIVNGAAVLTQCDVKNRWPDGSVRSGL